MDSVHTISAAQELVREAKSALAGCEDVRLEEVLFKLHALSGDVASTALELDTEIRAEVDAFSKVLGATRENAEILRGLNSPGSVHLEYRPSVGWSGDGALY